MSGSIKPNKRRAQRFKAATGLPGIELGSGAAVKIRDFSTEALALESSVQVATGKAVELEFPIGDQPFGLRGMVVRTDRLPSVAGVPNYLMVVALAWYTPVERLHIAAFLNAIRKSVRAA